MNKCFRFFPVRSTLGNVLDGTRGAILHSREGLALNASHCHEDNHWEKYYGFLVTFYNRADHAFCDITVLGKKKYFFIHRKKNVLHYLKRTLRSKLIWPNDRSF